MEETKKCISYHFVARWYANTMEYTLDGVCKVDFKVTDYLTYKKLKDEVIYQCILKEMNVTEEDIPNKFSVTSLSLLDQTTKVVDNE